MSRPYSAAQILGQLKSYLIFSNVLYLFGPMFVSWFFPTWSYENLLYFGHRTPFSYAASFDSNHYLNNTYQFQINYAFLPGYVTFVHAVKYVCACIFSDSVQPTMTVLFCIAINKILTALCTVPLYRIAEYYMPNNPKFALRCCVLFLFNPACIFYHGVYSQPLYSFLTFNAISLVLSNHSSSIKLIDIPLKYLATNFVPLFLISLSVSIRTTAMFLTLIFATYLLNGVRLAFINLQVSKLIKICISGGLTLAISAAFFYLYLYYGYRQFCLVPPYSPFCSESLIPNVYSYVQKAFWQVGFLNYYHPQRTLFIVIGTPSMIAALVAIRKMGIIKSCPGLSLSYFVLLFVTIFYSNVQSSARFFSSHPVYILSLARYLAVESGNNEMQLSFRQKLIVTYLGIYNALGLIFFPVRFPWT